MSNHRCKNCSFREKYDRNPQSFWGRIWRWHASWCPGWKSYLYTLPDDQRMELAEKYGLIKYK